MKHFIILALSLSLTTGGSGYNLVYNYRGLPAPLSIDGKVIETPEVAQARAAHLAAHAAAVARVVNSSKEKWNDSYDSVKTEENNSDETMTKNESSDKNGRRHIYRGPLAPLDENGQVIDTPEVMTAKAAHLAAHAAQNSILDTNQWDNKYQSHIYTLPPYVQYSTYDLPMIYRGPPAPLAPDGKVMDTPEVAQARIDHQRAHAHAKATIAAAAASMTNHYETCNH